MRSLPNAIALLRAAMVIPVVLLVQTPEAVHWALALFCLAALTDALDGPLARALGATTRLGAFLDPLADKVLVIGTLLALVELGAAPLWVALVILTREAAVTFLRGAAAARGTVLETSGYGKAKTVVQATAVAVAIFAVAVPGHEVSALASAALFAAVALTLASGVQVLARAPSAIFPVIHDPLADAR